MNTTRKLDERGGVLTIVSLVLLTLLLVGAIVFGAWAFGERRDFKENVDAKIAVAVKDNTAKVKQQDAKDYAEAIKNPLKTFVGPQEFGSLHLDYPRTWSVYSAGQSGTPVDLYMYPDVVPLATGLNSVFALRAQVVPTAYDQVMLTYAGLQKGGKVTISPYALAKNSTVIGSRVDGQIAQNKQGAMIVLPLRDKTLKIWTESNDFLNDFNTTILPNASFVP